jgi:ribosomal protein S18 acetylase RimI-like enzyme
LSALWIRQAHDGGGGKKLRQIGATKINLQVRASNQSVVSFYEKLGYAVEERVSMGKKLM